MQRQKIDFSRKLEMTTFYRGWPVLNMIQESRSYSLLKMRLPRSANFVSNLGCVILEHRFISILAISRSRPIPLILASVAIKRGGNKVLVLNP